MGWMIEDEDTIELIHNAIIDSQYLCEEDIRRYKENPELSMEENDVEAADMIQYRKEMLERLYELNKTLTNRNIKMRGGFDRINEMMMEKFNVALDADGNMSEENLQKLRLIAEKKVRRST